MHCSPLPSGVYQRNLGWLLTHRMLALTYRGRRSGRTLTTVDRGDPLRPGNERERRFVRLRPNGRLVSQHQGLASPSDPEREARLCPDPTPPVARGSTVGCGGVRVRAPIGSAPGSPPSWSGSVPSRPVERRARDQAARLASDGGLSSRSGQCHPRSTHPTSATRPTHRHDRDGAPQGPPTADPRTASKASRSARGPGRHRVGRGLVVPWVAGQRCGRPLHPEPPCGAMECPRPVDHGRLQPGRTQSALGGAVATDEPDGSAR